MASLETTPTLPIRGSGAVSTQHSERCKACKTAIKRLLRELYGFGVQRLDDIPTKPDELPPSTANDIKGKLHEIYAALKNERGNFQFVFRKTMPACDFLVGTNPRFIVEFDESQHFTPLRKLSLSLYPRDRQFGFNVVRWTGLSAQLQRHDNRPFYRDEQRAWYDTLRDFAPFIIPNLGPTIRLYALDRVWCELDVDAFRRHLCSASGSVPSSA